MKEQKKRNRWFVLCGVVDVGPLGADRPVQPVCVSRDALADTVGREVLPARDAGLAGRHIERDQRGGVGP